MPRKRKKLTTAPPTVWEGRTTGRPPGRPPLVTIRLQVTHCINGKEYGPGMVTVDRDLAAFLGGQEENFKWTEEYLHKAGSAMIGAGSRLLDSRGHRINPGDPGLPDGFFENPNSDLALSPVSRISGGGR